MEGLSNNIFEFVNCDLCGSDKTIVLFKADVQEEEFPLDFTNMLQGKLSIQKCSECGLIYLNPRLKNTKDTQRYYTEHLTPLLKLSESPFERILYSVYYFLTRKLPKKTGRLLDIGCGNGRYIAYLQRRGWEVQGIEPEYPMYAVAKEMYGLNVFNGTTEGFFLNHEDRFDVITIFQTLEHVSSPTKVLSICKQLLKDDGVIVIGNQPNFKSLDQKIFRAENTALGVPYHLYHFDAGTLKKLCEKLDFKIEEIKYEFFVPTQLSYNLLSWIGRRFNIKINVKLKLMLCAILFPFLVPMYVCMYVCQNSLTFTMYLKKSKPTIK